MKNKIIALMLILLGLAISFFPVYTIEAKTDALDCKNEVQTYGPNCETVFDIILSNPIFMIVGVLVTAYGYRILQSYRSKTK